MDTNDASRCPECGESLMGETEADRAAFYDWHKGTLGHQVGALGKHGRDLRHKLRDEADRILRRVGIIRR